MTAMYHLGGVNLRHRLLSALDTVLVSHKTGKVILAIKRDEGASLALKQNMEICLGETCLHVALTNTRQNFSVHVTTEWFLSRVLFTDETKVKVLLT